MCVQNITVEFDVNTSVPILEVPAKLANLISFDVQELNSGKKFGRWMDHRTMAVFFAECVSWDGRTTSGKERPIHIIFEADGGWYLDAIVLCVERGETLSTKRN